MTDTPAAPAVDAEREKRPTVLAVEIAGTVLNGIHDEPLEYVLRRGYSAMGMAPGLAAMMCQRLADCQTDEAATLTTQAERAEADNARLRAENAGLREALTVGDRVRINRNAGSFCDGYDDGGERFVRGISVDKELKVNVWLCDHWPPRDGGDDGWEPRMLDKIAALSIKPQAAGEGD